MKQLKNRVITIVGAKEHNLKNITATIHRDSLTVITGPSGSGKSTLAMDVLYAEGQRRYMESLSSYARQFLGMPQKPNVDRIEGLCPAIAIDQKTVGSNPRSTVGTITEISDYLRVFFARIGIMHCPTCHKKVETASAQVLAERLVRQLSGNFVTIAAPIAVEKKGEFVAELEALFAQGHYRFLINGQRCVFRSVADIKNLNLKKTFKHSIDLLIDALEVNAQEQPRILEALEKAFALTGSLCKIIKGDEHQLYSSARMCVTCGSSFPELEPRYFSFNSPLGACKMCQGLGVTLAYAHYMTGDDQATVEQQPCPKCLGRRLHDHALAVTVGGKNIYEIGQLSLKEAYRFFDELDLDAHELQIVDRLLAEIKNRLAFLKDVGLEYLSLNRTARTLSGGEGQRVRLATQIGSALSGVVYVLDEPSIGLHQRDNDRLIATLKKLRDQGNTVVVVEHDHDTIMAADHVIDMGPAAGIHGGNIIAVGTPEELAKNPASLTGSYLSGARAISRSGPVRKPKGFITLTGAQANNLCNLTVEIPLGVMCCVSGVSGSGKSTLIMQELVPSLQKALVQRVYVESERLKGVESLEYCVVIDQSPIGRTPRSNPATYLGIFDDIRKLFASLPESNARGYGPGRFSFNVGEGRCSQCSGDGVICVSMHLLPDVIMTCSRCKGTRYNQQTLEITFKGKSIADILAMTAFEAREFFAAHSTLAKRLQLLCDVGLEYLTLGQPSTTLSGGEAQRVKLADELAKRGNKTLYVLDEPTTGLHAHDIEKLLKVFHALVAKGNSLLIIEHNLDVLKVADYLIDLGPEGGDEGGMIVATGTPEEVARNPESITGRYLARALKA